RHNLLQLTYAKVRDADRAGVAQFTSSLHSRPGSRRTTLGPVDEVQIDVVDAEPPEAALHLRGRVPASRIELCREEHLRARHAAVPERLPDALLVAVQLGGVNVPVPHLKRPAYSFHALEAVPYLPNAQGEHREALAVGEHSRALISCIRNRRHGGSSHRSEGPISLPRSKSDVFRRRASLRQITFSSTSRLPSIRRSNESGARSRVR